MNRHTDPAPAARRRRRHVISALLAGLAVAALLIPAGAAGARTRTAAATTAPSCGATVYKSDGSAWQCSFDDEFSGSRLDGTKWFVQTTAASGFHSGAECFTNSAQNVAVANGTLNLTVRRTSPFFCKTPNGGYNTQYTSGTVNTLNRFAQTYGRFEVRAQLPATTVRGLQETLWLWPVNQYKYGVWPMSGEIDFAEFYSQYAGWNIPYLHYGVLQSTVSWLTNSNVYTAFPAPYSQPGMNCRINQSGFNTFTLTWQPGQLVIRVNGSNCIVNNYSAYGLSGAAPFDQPFFLALTQALGIGSNAPTSSTPLPATTRVDYVRIWK
jgi:beta-glucanase (GH16 family)